MPKRKTVKIDNNPTLERDIESRAVINTDISAYHAFINRKRSQRERDDALNNLRSRVSKLEALIEKLISSNNVV